MENMDEYSKFKSLLEYFVAHLEYCQNEIMSPGTGKNTRGYQKYIKPIDDFKKKGAQVQKVIEPWTSYKDCAERIFFHVDPYSGTNYAAENNYLRWGMTGYNIVACWKSDSHQIIGLERLVYVGDKDPAAKENRVGRSGVVSLDDLGLFDDKEPNETLKKFFDEFKKMYEDDTYKLRNQSTTPSQDMNSKHSELVEKLKELLKASHNLILHGAPGTGKTYLAKKIAKEMGAETDFVQFHPSYDYTDFVEGLRPKKVGSDEIGFELKGGVFKEFCKKALKNLQDSEKSEEELQKEKTLDEKMENFLAAAIEKEETDDKEKYSFETATGNGFNIIEINETSIRIEIPNNPKVKELLLQKSDLMKLLTFDGKIENGGCLKTIFNHKWRTQQDSYLFALYDEIQKQKDESSSSEKVEKVQKKDYVFIIDEINRGEMSKIFGELFYAVDPGYRVTGKALKKHKSGDEKLFTIRTQYANLEKDGNEFDNALNITDLNDFGHFFVPENVYIIGTMNDIDRSVDTMDFAFRRRFAFKEIKANENFEMLDALPEDVRSKAINRMKNLNAAIENEKIGGLSSAYHIGGAYFKKLEECNNVKKLEGCDNVFKTLWTLHLEGLLREYLRGQEDASGKLDKLKEAYNNEAELKSDSQNDSSSSAENSTSGNALQGEN